MEKMVTAIRFLTVLPLPGGATDSPKAVAASVPFFPLVGLLIGGVLALFAATVGAVFPVPVRAVLLVLLWCGLDYGMHFDGLADTADAFYGHRSAKRALEIMKDSRLGTMGVLALVIVFSLRCVCLASLPPLVQQQALLLAPLAGRTTILWGSALLPAARSQGLGWLFTQGRQWWEPLGALLFLGGALYAGAGAVGGYILVALVVLFGAFGRWSIAKVGGMTGDTAGALCIITETLVLLAFVAALPIVKM